MINYLANQVEVDELVANASDDIGAYINVQCSRTALAVVTAGAIIMKNGGSTSSDLMERAFNFPSDFH